MLASLGAFPGLPLEFGPGLLILWAPLIYSSGWQTLLWAVVKESSAQSPHLSTHLLYKDAIGSSELCGVPGCLYHSNSGLS
jgi:hypothetical protein